MATDEKNSEEARKKAFEEINEVPPVVETVDSTPKTVIYGAAILLGLTFGLGCYVWYDGEVPSYSLSARGEGYDYFNRANHYDYWFYRTEDIPAPFEVTAYTAEPVIVSPDQFAVPDVGR